MHTLYSGSNEDEYIRLFSLQIIFVIVTVIASISFISLSWYMDWHSFSFSEFSTTVFTSTVMYIGCAYVVFVTWLTHKSPNYIFFDEGYLAVGSLRALFEAITCVVLFLYLAPHFVNLGCRLIEVYVRVQALEQGHDVVKMSSWICFMSLISAGYFFVTGESRSGIFSLFVGYIFLSGADFAEWNRFHLFMTEHTIRPLNWEQNQGYLIAGLFAVVYKATYEETSLGQINSFMLDLMTLFAIVISGVWAAILFRTLLGMIHTLVVYLIQKVQ